MGEASRQRSERSEDPGWRVFSVGLLALFGNPRIGKALFGYVVCLKIRGGDLCRGNVTSVAIQRGVLFKSLSVHGFFESEKRSSQVLMGGSSGTTPP